MFSPIVRYLAWFIIGVATFVLASGALLYQAAAITGATSDYTVLVSWPSAFASVLWPPTRLPFLSLASIAILAGFTIFIFFRAPRPVGVILLFVQAIIGFFLGGWLGWYFIRREFERYHFNMDAEKLGENWFTYESVAVWTLAALLLAGLRIFARKDPVATPANKPPSAV